MANITLPSNPVNGQTVVIGTRLFQYDSTAGRWKSRVFQVLGDTSVTVTNEAPTITASLSEIALDTSGANVSFTYTVSDADSSLLKVSHSVSGIANSDLATVTHHRANSTVTITAGTEEFSGGQITLNVTDGRNNATDTVDVSAVYANELEFGATYTTSSDTLTADTFGNPNQVNANEDGTFIYAFWSTEINQWELSTPWDFSTATKETSSMSWGHPNQNVFGIAFNPAGTVAVVFDEGQFGKLYQYDLTTPFDLTTATYNASVGEISLPSYPIQHLDGAGIVQWLDSGNKLFICSKGRIIAECGSVTTPYTLNGFSSIGQIRLDGDVPGSYGNAGAKMSEDGTEIYIFGGTQYGTGMTKYDLSTAFDPSTADLSNETTNSSVFPTAMTASAWSDGKHIVFNSAKTISIMTKS